jgi:hypothetical protein
MKAFETFVDNYSHNGFSMSFENGFTISVQFSKYHRCDAGNTTAEVAIWDKDNNWYLFSDGTWQKMPQYAEVMSYQTANEVANLIKQTSIK